MTDETKNCVTNVRQFCSSGGDDAAGGIGADLCRKAGATEILDRWVWDEQRLPVLLDDAVLQTEYGRPGLEAFDLRWLPATTAFAERLLVRWGTGTRAWSQWASRNEKEILEIRQQPYEPPFDLLP